MRLADEREHRRLIAQAVAERSGLVTLAVSAPSTTLSDARIRFNSVILLVATTANAAAELANGTLWIPESGRVNGIATIAHANNAQADRTYRYLIG